MKEKQKELLRILMEQNKAVTSNTLASLLAISQRTIKNYVKEINDMASERVIFSSRSGYYVNQKQALAILEQEDSLRIPQTYMERAYYIIKRLLLDHQTVNLFELCEDLHISYSTLKNEVSKMNKTFQHFAVSFVSQENIIQIKGTEKAKRKLMSHIIYEETNNNFFNLEVLFENYGKDYINHLSQIINGVFKSNDYYINDFSFMNLILHLTILIDRVRYGKYVNTYDNLLIEGQTKSKIVIELCDKIETQFGLSLNQSEISEIHMLFKTDVNISSNSQEIKDLVGQDGYQQALSLVESVYQTYMIDLNNDTFIIPFSLHLKSLLRRLENKTYNKNPMIDNIKHNCPMIYEIAVFISIQLANQLNVSIVEDEVAYLALHVGTEIERQKQNDEKIKCVLLCPEYMAIEDKLTKFLLSNFGEDLTIISSLSYQHQLDPLTFDLLVTTLDIERSPHYETFLISPFAFEKSKTRLYQVLDQINLNKKKNILNKNFDQFFSPDLFQISEDYRDKETLILGMSQKMQQLGLVTEQFGTHVLEREHMSSTVFGHIAIPHSIQMDAIKTSISVLISHNGIKWDNQLVNIVLMTAINDIDRRHFRLIYEALLEIFEGEEVPRLIREVKDFESFKLFIDGQA